jgi:hypothetical protein
MGEINDLQFLQPNVLGSADETGLGLGLGLGLGGKKDVETYLAAALGATPSPTFANSTPAVALYKLALTIDATPHSNRVIVQCSFF